MSVKDTLFILSFIFFSALLQGQIADNYGILTNDEISFSEYDKDSTANAVVLYEKGNYYFEVRDNNIWLVKNFHRKTKILKDEGFDYANISIPYYKNDKSREKVTKIKAVTHNGRKKTFLEESQIYNTDKTERWSNKVFTFPNIKKGSIVEYQYQLISPFFFNLDGWNFQSSIPKIYSEFNAEIPGNYTYNRTLVGELKLSVNDASIKSQCFSIPGYSQVADCEVLKYVMKDIPAFKEEEDYMLAASNYISRLDFELSEYRGFDGTTDKFTKSWKNVDREFKTDKDIGGQLTKKSFFEKNVPDDLFTGTDQLSIAKNIYKYIQKHYTWNEKNSTYGKARVRDAFKNKIGNAWEINMSLINLLNAADIKANLVLTSTRKNGLPGKRHPVISDFNYVLAKISIDDKEYLLDATDKSIPFGMLPFRALNYYGRVMDFKNESYWQDITPENNNKVMVFGQLEFDQENNTRKGLLNVTSFGYNAVYKGQKMNSMSNETYIESLKNSLNGDAEIDNYQRIDDGLNEKKVIERFEYEQENEQTSIIYLNPFILKFFEKNPFLLEERNYPIDFGYPRNYRYQVNIKVPEGYVVEESPKKQHIQLPKNQASLKFAINENKNMRTLNMIFDLKISHAHIQAAYYQGLKELFEYVTTIQNNSLIVLKKVE